MNQKYFPINPEPSQNNDRKDSQEELQEIPVVELLQKIRDGELDPKQLHKEDRFRCEIFMQDEGYAYPSISQLLRISEKTIQRDFKEIRKRNSFEPSLDLAIETVGELMQAARTHRNYLMRLARGSGSSSASKAQSEFLSWRVFKELIERLQSLGFLPREAESVSGDIYHHVVSEEGSESYDQVKKMLSDIEVTAKETNSLTPELAAELDQLKARLEKAEVSLRAKQLLKRQQNNQNKESQHGS